MKITVNTTINLNFDSDEYSYLVAEMSTYAEENDTVLGNTLELFYDDLIENQKVYEFTTLSKIEMQCFGGEMFWGLESEIEEIDIDTYPTLSNFLITLVNKI